MNDVPPATLTEAQREQFTRYPELDEQLLARHYLLVEADLRLVGEVSGHPDDTPRTVALWAYLHGFALLTLSGQLGLSGDQGGFQIGLEALIRGFGTARNGAETSVPAAGPG